METGHSTVYADVYQLFNASYGPHLQGPVPLQGQPAVITPPPPPTPRTKQSDPSGEGYYVIAVFLVYGMSIVLLIASHIRRKHSKLAIDKEIVKYLQEFQIVKETSNRDSYRNLKRSIIAKLLREKNMARKGVANLALPMAAVAMPSDDPPSGSNDDEEEVEEDDDDDVVVGVGVGDALSADRSKSYVADLDTWMEEDEEENEEGQDPQGHQSLGQPRANDANSYHGNQIRELTDDEFRALKKVKQAELIRHFAFDGNGYHVIRIPEVSDGEPEAVVGRRSYVVDAGANGYHHGCSRSIRTPQLRPDELEDGSGRSGRSGVSGGSGRSGRSGGSGGSGARSQLKSEAEVSGLHSSAAEYTRSLRGHQVNVGLAFGSRDPRWILLPLLLENRMRADRQDNEDRREEEVVVDDEEEVKSDAQDDETVKCRDGDGAGDVVAVCSSVDGVDDVVSYTYVL